MPLLLSPLPLVLVALLLVQPVIAVVVGVVLFTERPSASQLLGVALVLGGVVLTTLGTRRSPVEPIAAAPDQPLTPTR